MFRAVSADSISSPGLRPITAVFHSSNQGVVDLSLTPIIHSSFYSALLSSLRLANQNARHKRHRPIIELSIFISSIALFRLVFVTEFDFLSAAPLLVRVVAPNIIMTVSIYIQVIIGGTGP